MHTEPLHRVWCDRRHVEVGSPNCSAVVGRVEVITVMLFAQGETDTHVSITDHGGTSLLVWPPHLMLSLVRILEEATQIAIGTWPPLLDDSGAAVDPWRYGGRLVDEAEHAIRTFLKAETTIDRATAARFLQSWERYGELTAEDVRIVLDRFGPAPGATQ